MMFTLLYFLLFNCQKEYEKYTYIYNKELNAVIVHMRVGCIFFYKQQADGQWTYDMNLHKFCQENLLAYNKTEAYTYENHISPDGKYVLGLKNEFKVYKLVKKQESNDLDLIDT